MSDNFDVVAPAETIDDFRRVEALSKASFYKLEKLGLAPRTYRVPNTKIVRIVKSHASWRERIAALSASKAAELETARRRELARVAGKRAAEIRRSRQPPQAACLKSETPRLVTEAPEFRGTSMPLNLGRGIMSDVYIATAEPRSISKNTKFNTPDLGAPDHMVVAVAQTFAAAFASAVEFGGCGYAEAAEIAAETVQAAIANAGRAP